MQCHLDCLSCCHLQSVLCSATRAVKHTDNDQIIPLFITLQRPHCLWTVLQFTVAYRDFDDLVSFWLCNLSELLFLPSFLSLCLCIILLPVFQPTSNLSTFRASSSSWVAKAQLKQHIPKQAHPWTCPHTTPHLPHLDYKPLLSTKYPSIFSILAFMSLYYNLLSTCLCLPPF